MEIHGRVEGGVVVMEGEATLPEGMADSVVPRASPVIRVAKHQRRVVLPLVPSEKPGSVDLTGERIAEILQEQACTFLTSMCGSPWRLPVITGRRSGSGTSRAVPALSAG